MLLCFVYVCVCCVGLDMVGLVGRKGESCVVVYGVVLCCVCAVLGLVVFCRVVFYCVVL